MVSISGAIAALAFVFFLHFTYNFIKKATEARKIGAPVVFVPVNQASLLWLILSASRRRQLQQLLPAWLWKRVSIAIAGWEFPEKKRPFEEYAARNEGDENKTFVILGLRQFELWTADPTATAAIVQRIRDFEVPKSMGTVLGRFGPNVLTTNGDQWARHRKIVASVINERISKTVFEESLSHSRVILGKVLATTPDKTGSTDTPRLFDMLTSITLKVLIGTGLGDKVPWKHEDEEELEPGYKMTYTESLGTVVDNALGLGILPVHVLLKWPSWLPGHLLAQTVACAMTEVRNRNLILLDHERNRIHSSESSGKPDLMSSLVKASEEGGKTGQSLSEDEMISNLFIFTAGGFKTTAATLAYGVVLLARLPQWQEWLLEEVDKLTSAEGLEALEYTATFPRAVRLFAFVMETTRLYGGSSRLFRKNMTPQSLETSQGTVHLPAGTSVYVNSVVLHRLSLWRNLNHSSDPAFFQPDPSVPDEETFRPSRWINPPGSAHTHYRPPKGTFMAWSGGPRICPGQKMAQIEFTAVMITLLRRHRIEATPLPGETRSDLERRLDVQLVDSNGSGVMVMNGIYQPKEGEGLSVRVVQRK